MRATHYRRDYKKFGYSLNKVWLSIDITSVDLCTVKTRIDIQREPQTPHDEPLFLHGEDITLLSVAVDGEKFPASNYTLTAGGLTIFHLPERCILDIVNQINPAANNSYLGVYQEGEVILADNEPEGFRRITFYPDRPDVKSVFEVKLTADKSRYPTLLSNGHIIDTGDLPSGRHFITWLDPLPKSCYVFTMVVGDLATITDTFTTMSGRKVALAVYAHKDGIEQYRSGITSLKKAMQWDEQQYGREYDLDVFNIVVLPAYNQGGMEYRGLNIYSASTFLSDGHGVCDEVRIVSESVIGHEYFHNWVGNRVGCRDWFNLTLKEGFVVFKHQEFSGSLIGKDLRRILDIKYLRDYQYPEDDSLSSQPVRPDSYVAVQNLYTRSVYEKGAEIVRMLKTLVGEENFRKGSDLFHLKHDFGAVEVGDFIAAFGEASRLDLSQFCRWYTQRGRPALEVSSSYDETEKTFELRIRQILPNPPPGHQAQPYLIPLVIGLLDDQGNELDLQIENQSVAPVKNLTLGLRLEQETYKFINVTKRPIPSLLRKFSAPVDLRAALECEDLAVLVRHDSDAYVRWNSSQELMKRAVLAKVGADPRYRHLQNTCIDTLRFLLADKALDRGLCAMMIKMPSEAHIASSMKIVEVDAVHKARVELEHNIASALKDEFLRSYEDSRNASNQTWSPLTVGARLLKREALSYLSATREQQAMDLCREQIYSGETINDEISAIACLLRHDASQACDLFYQVYDKWSDNDSVSEKLLMEMAAAEAPHTPSRLREFISSARFDLKNPVQLRAIFDHLIRNQIGFHEKNGSGYQLLSQVALQLNDINPRMAARFLFGFGTWKRFDGERQRLIRSELEKIAAAPHLADELYEIVSLNLA